MSPSLRRTHWPSFRSMAGKRITLAALVFRTGPGPAITSLSSGAINRDPWPASQAECVVLPIALHPVATASKRRLSEADAIDIWIARWLRIRRKDLLLRYGCDPRRLYEIWEEKRFTGSRDKALEL